MNLFRWITWLWRPEQLALTASPLPTQPVEGSESLWCVVANVLHQRPYGPQGAELRRGTKHFDPGAKVYVFDFFWGTGGERVKVIGRHRKTHRFITLIMDAKHLANWRAELVYSPHVMKQVQSSGEFARFSPGSPESKRRAEEIASSYVKQGASSQPYTTRSKY